jgi:hypothetical protein
VLTGDIFMKFSLTLLFVLASGLAMGKDVKDFNKVLMEDVQKDINTDNDQALKTRESVTRAPASVEEDEEATNLDDSKELDKIEKNFKQLGSKNW